MTEAPGQNFTRTEKWDTEAPINLDLSGYIRPAARKGDLRFAWICLGLASICIFFLVFRSLSEFFQKYYILMEVFTGGLLFVAGKSWFAYARNTSRFLRWDLTAGRILSISEDARGHSFLEMEFYPTGVSSGRVVFTDESNDKSYSYLYQHVSSSDRVVFTEEYNCPLIDAVKNTGLNALPVLFQPSRAAHGAYYVDLRFRNRELDRDNLRLKDPGSSDKQQGQ